MNNKERMPYVTGDWGFNSEESVLIRFEDVTGYVNIYSQLFKQIVAHCIDDFELQMMNIKVD